MSFATTDLCDDNPGMLDDGSLQVLSPFFRHFGKRARFAGPAATLKVHEDNALVRATLETPGAGRVLVVDGGGSLRRALVGGQLGLLAQNNGWAGVIVDGCVRDSAELAECDVGIMALATHPQRSARDGVGKRDVNVQVAGVAIQPGDWIYADLDGVLVARQKLA
ncbi:MULTISPECIES: ribonuclease E activity regulator RraA [unclassified Duganella]|uniref:ribonuclease E activity regulator RraA n=1 Tax=unclassified Duganella TaxID=2636909 RepID=UPI0006F46498|nr:MULTISPECIES: ribonuclease E activity regulator RraA [unclassified Duganella]KQV46117.1 ribonuclease [Duganella sp. Root336D2]KRB81784.1 ribonuclease [Duganella sp. Root198D2]